MSQCRKVLGAPDLEPVRFQDVSHSHKSETFKGTKALCQGEAEVCVSLVFKITIASKRTACYSFSIIHIFLAFINTRGQRVLAKHLRATAEVGTPSDIIGV